METDGSFEVKLCNKAAVVPHVDLVVAVAGGDQLNRELGHPQVLGYRHWLLSLQKKVIIE